MHLFLSLFLPSKDDFSLKTNNKTKAIPTAGNTGVKLPHNSVPMLAPLSTTHHSVHSSISCLKITGRK